MSKEGAFGWTREDRKISARVKTRVASCNLFSCNLRNVISEKIAAGAASTVVTISRLSNEADYRSFKLRSFSVTMFIKSVNISIDINDISFRCSTKCF